MFRDDLVGLSFRSDQITLYEIEDDVHVCSSRGGVRIRASVGVGTSVTATYCLLFTQQRIS